MARVRADGDVYTWGRGEWGQLGPIGSQVALTPTKLPAKLFGGKKIKAVAAGEVATMALAEDGSLYTWGMNGSAPSGHTPTPSLVDRKAWFGDREITAIAAGSHHYVALAVDGTFFNWGNGEAHQLLNSPKSYSYTPLWVNPVNFDGKKIRSIAAGGNATAVITRDGSLFTWGENHSGQLGNGTTQKVVGPVRYPADQFGGAKVSSVAVGNEHMVAVTESGGVYSWGRNDAGQLGLGTFGSTLVPTPVSADSFDGGKLGAVSAGFDFTVATTVDGVVYAWGNNDSAQLGSVTAPSSSTPRRVDTGMIKGQPVSTVSAGRRHAAVIAGGSVLTWGDNSSGQLGLGTTAAVSEPTKFHGPTISECPKGAKQEGNVCSLSPGTTYFYRLSYTIGDRTGPSSNWTPLTTLTDRG